MIEFIRKCIASALVVGAAVFLTAALGVESRVPGILALFGSLAFFFGEYLTEAGFTWGFYRVDTETPEVLWKILGVLMWIVAASCLAYLWWHRPG